MLSKQIDRFEPYQHRKDDTSSPNKVKNPQETLMKLELIKLELTLAEQKEDIAFRGRKQRALRRLHKRAGWFEYNSDEQAMEERKLIDILEAGRDARKQHHRRELKRKFEIEEAGDQPDFQFEEAGLRNVSSQNEPEDRDEVESWYGFSQNEEVDEKNTRKEVEEEETDADDDDDEDEDEDEDEEDEEMNNAIGVPSGIDDLIDIQNRVTKEYFEMLDRFEEEIYEKEESLTREYVEMRDLFQEK
jgi:hypothetical protein